MTCEAKENYINNIDNYVTIIDKILTTVTVIVCFRKRIKVRINNR